MKQHTALFKYSGGEFFYFDTPLNFCCQEQTVKLLKTSWENVQCFLIYYSIKKKDVLHSYIFGIHE